MPSATSPTSRAGTWRAWPKRLVPLLSDDPEQAVAMATEVIVAFPAQYRRHLLRGQRAKLGLRRDDPDDDRADTALVDFLDRAKADPILERSAYHRILRSIGTDRSGAPTRYPGSSALAMMLLGPRAVYRLWDIDGDSVRSIREAAQELGVAEYVVVSSGDGIDGIVSGIRELPVGQAHRTLVFVDPFDPAASSLAHGISSVEAAHIVAARDVPLVY